MIFKQPNGLYGRISTVADAPTHVDMTLDDVERYLFDTGQISKGSYFKTATHWLEKYAFDTESAIELVNTNNMTQKEIKEWKIKIGYQVSTQ